MASTSHALGWLLAVTLVGLACRGAAAADPAPFDLTGPSLQIRVSHGGHLLPIAEVPNLAAGDQIWVKAQLPPSQSVRYLLVAAFLRGATNPPPPAWFFRADTWKPQVADGLRVTVPDGAEQMLVFLAPETGGDFKTIVDAVRGRPGAFVRASQDLNQATLDRSRLDAFLAAIRRVDQASPDDLKTVSPLLARSLIIKFDSSCLQKMPELQAPCLMQGQDSLVLNDGHSASIVQALSTGSPADLVQQLSNAPRAGAGYYSPYIASLMDIARIMDSLHTAQYLYIPALATKSGDQMALLLNTPPSFHDPKSVLVAALPAVGPPQPPPLHPVDPDAAYCAEASDLVLPVEGAPLAFSTAYAHDLVLRVRQKNGRTVDWPVKADPERGGLVLDTHGLDPTAFADAFDGQLHGYWGFDPFDGPRFRLESVHGQAWSLDPDDREALVAGQEGVVRLEAADAACVRSVTLRPASGEAATAAWKPDGAARVRITASLKAIGPGPASLVIDQYADAKTEIPVTVFAPPSRLDKFAFHAGDTAGVLTGLRLDEVASLSLGGVAFTPGTLSHGPDGEALAMTAGDAAAALKPGASGDARVTLKDGRSLELASDVDPARPAASLIGKTVTARPSRITLTGPDEIAQGAKLVFSLRAVAPASFPRDLKIEVAAGDDGTDATLTADSGLSFADAGVVVASLDTGKALGTSAFGALRYRVVEGGVAGDWAPLATLVRLPTLGGLHCPGGADQPCKLAGSELYLIDALSADPAFSHAIATPDGFTGSSLDAPHPAGGRLYLKLRDDPTVIDTVQLGLRGLVHAASTQP